MSLLERIPDNGHDCNPAWPNDPHYTPEAGCLAAAERLADLAHDHGYRTEIVRPEDSLIRLDVWIGKYCVSRQWRYCCHNYRGNDSSRKLRFHAHYFRRYGGRFDDAGYDPRCACAAGFEPWQLGLCGQRELELTIMTGHVPGHLIIAPQPVRDAERHVSQYGNVYYVTTLPALSKEMAA